MHKHYLDNIKKELQSLSDNSFKPYLDNVLGIYLNKIYYVRMNNIHNISKNIFKDNKTYIYLNENDFSALELKLIHGDLIAYLDYKEMLIYLNKFLEELDSWLVVDNLCSRLKIVKDNKEDFLLYINDNRLLKHNNPYVRRMVAVILLNYYKKDIRALNILKNIQINDDYYVKMGIAWALSYLYINFKEDIILELKNDNFDIEIKRMTISKIIDSLHTSKEDKEILKKVRDEYV